MKIDKNIPYPTDEKTKGRIAGASKYPFASMEVGDSFWSENLSAPSIRCAASIFNRSLPISYVFLIRKYNQDGKSGIRCWRIS